MKLQDVTGTVAAVSGKLAALSSRVFLDPASRRRSAQALGFMMNFNRAHGYALISAAFTMPAIVWWARKANQSLLDFITAWLFVVAVPLLFVSLRKRQPTICMIGTVIISLIGSGAVIYYSLDADVSTYAFAPLLAAITQLIGLGVICIATIKNN